MYNLAFLHSSAKVKNKSGLYINNERLEFLGDAVLDAVISKYLYDQFKNEKEGFLSKMRSKIVNRNNLNKIGFELGLHTFIQSNIEDIDQENDLLGNTLEALIGTIMLDRGYRFAEKFIFHRIIHPFINLTELQKMETNFKGKIIEWAQKKNIELNFSTIEKISKDNTHLFVCEIILEHKVIGTGTGRNKKEAQKCAAKNAWKNIDFSN